MYLSRRPYMQAQIELKTSNENMRNSIDTQRGAEKDGVNVNTAGKRKAAATQRPQSVRAIALTPTLSALLDETTGPSDRVRAQEQKEKAAPTPWSPGDAYLASYVPCFLQMGKRKKESKDRKKERKKAKTEKFDSAFVC